MGCQHLLVSLYLIVTQLVGGPKSPHQQSFLSPKAHWSLGAPKVVQWVGCIRTYGFSYTYQSTTDLYFFPESHGGNYYPYSHQHIGKWEVPSRGGVERNAAETTHTQDPTVQSTVCLYRETSATYYRIRQGQIQCDLTQWHSEQIGCTLNYGKITSFISSLQATQM